MGGTMTFLKSGSISTIRKRRYQTSSKLAVSPLRSECACSSDLGRRSSCQSASHGLFPTIAVDVPADSSLVAVRAAFVSRTPA
jgi:hypothetical protein